MSHSFDRPPKNPKEALFRDLLGKLDSMSEEDLDAFIAEHPELQGLADRKNLHALLYEAVTGEKPPTIQ